MFFPRLLNGAKNEQYMFGSCANCAQVLPDHLPSGSYVVHPYSSSQEVGIGVGSILVDGSIVGAIVREGSMDGEEVGFLLI